MDLVRVVEGGEQARQGDDPVGHQAQHGGLGQHRLERVGAFQAEGLVDRARAQVQIGVADLRAGQARGEGHRLVAQGFQLPADLAVLDELP